jgi:hypothetical protein
VRFLAWVCVFPYLWAPIGVLLGMILSRHPGGSAPIVYPHPGRPAYAPTSTTDQVRCLLVLWVSYRVATTVLSSTFIVLIHAIYLNRASINMIKYSECMLPAANHNSRGNFLTPHDADDQGVLHCGQAREALSSFRGTYRHVAQRRLNLANRRPHALQSMVPWCQASRQ